MSPEAFEPTISAVEGPQTHALDRAATGIGRGCSISVNILKIEPLLLFRVKNSNKMRQNSNYTF